MHKLAAVVIIAIILLPLASVLKDSYDAKHPSLPVNHELLEQISKRAANPWNRKVVDSCVGLLKQGDVVVRKGNDVTSEMLCLMNATDKSYSHCGIVLIENGYPFVYHSIGGEDNPDARLRRDSANFWFSPANNLSFGIVRLDVPENKKDNLSGIVRRYYRQGKRFDIKFDLKSEDRFYCAEFIYKVVNRAIEDSAYLQPITLLGYTFIGIDNLYLNPHAGFVCQIRYK